VWQLRGPLSRWQGAENFYWDDIPGGRLQPGTVDSAAAKQAAQTLARVEQLKLDGAIEKIIGGTQKKAKGQNP
jgi:hypothetical protein